MGATCLNHRSNYTLAYLYCVLTNSHYRYWFNVFIAHHRNHIQKRTYQWLGNAQQFCYVFVVAVMVNLMPALVLIRVAFLIILVALVMMRVALLMILVALLMMRVALVMILVALLMMRVALVKMRVALVMMQVALLMMWTVFQHVDF